MSVFERIAAKRRRDELDAPARATCLRCRREYTLDREAMRDATTCDLYCWWCAPRVASVSLNPVGE